MTTMTFTRKDPPQWLLDFWKEIDDKTFGKEQRGQVHLLRMGK
ncbi:hypothetical protein [Rhodanobacter sp. C01]|nr:hypothetical protein [Rhodanobacter sp. C01]